MLRPNRTAINHLNVILRKTRRHCMFDMVAVVTEQQYRAEHLWRLSLDHQHQVREDLAERRVSGNHLQNALLLRTKFSVILLNRRGDGRSGRHFPSLCSSKFCLFVIFHLFVLSSAAFYAWYVTNTMFLKTCEMRSWRRGQYRHAIAS